MLARPIGKALLVATVAIVAVLLWEARREGPDFGHYYDWGNAARTRNIFELHGDMLSRVGVPFSLAAALPGMLFAAVYGAAGDLMVFRTAAYVTGWTVAMLFWVSAVATLRSVVRGNQALVAFGAGALFVGTHSGFYSFTYSTEVFASAFVAATWAIALSRLHRGVLASAAVGVCAGLLLLVRPYLVLYAAAPLWLVVFGLPGGEWCQPRERRIIRAVAAAVPLVLAVIESAVVNRWMTGSPFRPAYVYGGFGFQSVDLLHPMIGAVLAHPWRGLLVYHPLYGVAFTALVVGAWRRGPLRPLWMATVGVVLVHLWVQSAWHIWWLGGSFGMRGLAPAALPLVVALVAAVAHGSGPAPRLGFWWVRLTLIACAWSFPLLREADQDHFYSTWSQLMTGRTSVALPMGVLVVAWTVVAMCRARWKAPDERAEITWSALAVVGASVGYLISRTDVGVSGTLLLVAAAAALCALVVDRLPEWHRAAAGRIGYVLVIALFATQAVIFGRLAGRTERYLASGSAPPRPFRSVGAVPVEDLRQNYLEYLNIQGFEDRKTRLRAYLNWLEIDRGNMTPPDRELSERVLRAISADPVTAAMFVGVGARNGTVHLTSSDSTEVTRTRAVNVAAAVPGVAAVEADMK